jgi:hypothetical protein
MCACPDVPYKPMTCTGPMLPEGSVRAFSSPYDRADCPDDIEYREVCSAAAAYFAWECEDSRADGQPFRCGCCDLCQGGSVRCVDDTPIHISWPCSPGCWLVDGNDPACTLADKPERRLS